ncbi:MAG: DUF4387 domain-containing protein [Spirochaetes bacterium]|nr:DUF4387 domain-containing protein [Spirochaetota bacterium]
MKLIDAAKVIRSKNAGPYELTMDIIFHNEQYFKKFKEKNILTPQYVADLYGIKKENVLKIVYFEPANAAKMTIKRIMVSGAPGETDIYGAQQHAPLLNIEY